MPGQPVRGGADHRPGRAAEQEAPPGQAVAGADGVRLLHPDHLVHVGLVEQRRPHAHAQARDHPPAGRAAEGDRTHAVHGDDPHRPVPVAEVARAAHQGPGGARADEQHVQAREVAGYLRRRRAEVRSPVARVGVLAEPHVPVVGGAQRTDVLQSRAQETAVGVQVGHDVHMTAQGLHQQFRRQIAPGVRHAQEPVTLARRDHAEGDAEVAGRGLDEDGVRCQVPVPLGTFHHLVRGLQLDGSREVEALALEIEAVSEYRLQVDEEASFVEGVGSGDHGHGRPPVTRAEDNGLSRTGADRGRSRR